MGDCLSKPKFQTNDDAPYLLKSSSFKQCFSLPSSIMYYITKNPSTSKCYSKLIKSCKHFFEKQRIFVAGNMNNTYICPNDDDECYKNGGECCTKFDISKNYSCNFWLIDKLTVYGPNFASILCSKLYRSEINDLTFYKTNVCFDDFKILVSNATEVYFVDYVKMVYSNENTVMLESILAEIPNCQIFQFDFIDDFSMITALTIQNIMKLQNLKNLKYFVLADLPEIFDVSDLSKFIGDYKDTRFYFTFRENISEAYTNQLDILIDTVLKSEKPKHLIYYHGMNEEKLKIMQAGYHND